MSYVIQNFIRNNYNTALTPRTKLIIFLKNKNVIFYLIKYFYNVFNYKYYNVYNIFYKYFFKNLLFKLKQLISFSRLNYYRNNFSISLIYWNLNYIHNFNFFFYKYNFFKNFNLTRIDLIPIKTFPSNFKNKFYKIYFFNLIFNFFNIWPDFNIKFNLNLSFFLINYNFQLYKFFNGPFFKIYNS